MSALPKHYLKMWRNSDSFRDAVVNDFKDLGPYLTGALLIQPFVSTGLKVGLPAGALYGGSKVLKKYNEIHTLRRIQGDQEEMAETL